MQQYLYKISSGFFFSILITCAAYAQPSQTDIAAAANKAQAPLASGLDNKPEKLKWLQDAGFGMFIHWSHDAQIGSVISHSMVGASDDYVEWFVKELPKTFNPKQWDADEVVSLARLCGMKYVVLTAKHHSGFCLWDTKTTDFNIMNTPYGKDVLRDYVQALRKHGIKVGVYYSPEDFWWCHQNGHEIRRREIPFDPDTHPPFVEFVKRQVTELFTNYGQIDMLFIDGDGEVPTKETAWTLQPDCLITRGAIATPEQHVPGRPLEGAWESCLTMGTQWQYKPTNDDYKSGGRLIEILIETRAKGGALLLNVGPKPNGELPIEQESRLREVALWNAVNHECIYNTRPWVVTNEGPIWFTRRTDANTVYAVLTKIPDWPRGDRKEFVLQSVRASEGTKISVLGQNDRVVEYKPTVDATSRFEQTDEGLKISVVRAQRLYNDHGWPNPIVVKLENVEPTIDVPPYAETLQAVSTDRGKVVFAGRLLELGGVENVKVGIEYQKHFGFAKATYNTHWTRTKLSSQSEAGDYEVAVSGLEPGQEYKFRTVVVHPRLTTFGDYLRVVASDGVKVEASEE